MNLSMGLPLIHNLWDTSSAPFVFYGVFECCARQLRVGVIQIFVDETKRFGLA
jgi:hypothetical protein